MGHPSEKKRGLKRGFIDPDKCIKKIDDDIINKVFEHISNSIDSVNKACAKVGIDNKYFKELIITNPYYKELYEIAKDIQIQNIEDQILEIADNPSIDPNQIKRDTLRIESRKWILMKLKPDFYGNRIDVNNRLTIIEQPLFNLNDISPNNNISDGEFENI
jgi:hypothetical protein